MNTFAEVIHVQTGSYHYGSSVTLLTS